MDVHHLEGEGVSSAPGHIPCHKTKLDESNMQHTVSLWAVEWLTKRHNNFILAVVWSVRVP